jgi:hypothetical protein
LENHIIIPPPDADALIGIISHHLGADLNAVVDSKMNEITSDTSPALGNLVVHNTSTNSHHGPERQVPLDNTQTGGLAHE